MPVPLSQPISVAEAAAVHPTYADVLAWFERATGRPASVVRDPDGVIRFARNRLAVWLHEEQGVSLSAATIAYYHGQCAVDEYAEFVAGLGYSLSGFADLSAFSGHIWPVAAGVQESQP